MSGLAQAFKDIADKMATALGHDAAGAEKRLMHDTGDHLETNVKAHVEHDGRAAQELERAAGGDRTITQIAGGGDETPHAGAPAGPAMHAPPTLAGGPAGRTPLPGEQPLPNAHDPLSSKDYDYLAPKSFDREEEALDGPSPKPVTSVEPSGDNRTMIPPADVNNFDGPVRPVSLKAGTTYYRAVGDGTYPNGNYWTTSPPHGESGLRSDLAVLNSWNGDHGIVTFTPHEDMHIGWGGTVGPQDATGGVGHLPGGGHQIWIPAGRTGPGISDGDGSWTIAPMPEQAAS